MRFSIITLLRAILAAIAFASYADTLSIQSPDADLAVRAVPSDKAVFEYVGDNGLMAPHDAELVRRAQWTYNNNQKLFMTSITANAGVAAAACYSGNSVNCGIGVIYAIFTYFFAAWAFADRADTGELPNPFFVYPPLPGQRLVQRLGNELEQGKWHYVGHLHHKGLNHTVEYFNTGSAHKLRARNVPFWNETLAQGLAARQTDTDNDHGWVGVYTWNSNNEGPYDAFGSSSDSTEFFAQKAGGYMVNTAKSVASCASFSDASGTLDNGIIALGWNNQEYPWQPGEQSADFNRCASQE